MRRLSRSSEVGERSVFEQGKEMCVLVHIKALGLCVCLLVFHSLHIGPIFCHCYLTNVRHIVMQFSIKLYSKKLISSDKIFTNNSIRCDVKIFFVSVRE